MRSKFKKGDMVISLRDIDSEVATGQKGEVVKLEKGFVIAKFWVDRNEGYYQTYFFCPSELTHVN